MSEQSYNQPLEDEISLKDIIDFLVESWKSILATGVLGVLAAGTYIAVTPNQYEATAQIQAAQLSTGGITGTNIEDPNLLIARMKLPSSYDQASIVACGYEGKKQAAEGLAKMIKLSLAKGTQMVELKATGLSQEQATQCAQSVFNNIKQSQKMIADPIIEEAKTKLVRHTTRLQEAQTFISKADKSGSSMSAAYLSTRDEVKYLTDEVIRLNDLISSASSRQTKLVSPIYAPENKVSPKRAIALVGGLMGGLLLGLVLMMGLRAYRSYKASSQQ
jgi:capsular polysaccharide biosynthesis protein